MAFQITAEAKEYITQKNESIMIMQATMSGCCGGAAPIPKVELGTPKDLSGFEKTEVGKTTVYFDKNYEKKEIKIDLSKLLFLKNLTIEVTE